MANFILNSIGKITVRDDETVIELDKQYIPALSGMEGFGYLQILWWFSGCDNQESRAKLLERSPYKKGPDILGTFATRSPERPNPIALSCVYVTNIDYQNGIIGLAYIDAYDGSPVLDIKPYTPSLDRVGKPIVPEWCKRWPNRVEQSGDYDWENEFNF